MPKAPKEHLVRDTGGKGKATKEGKGWPCEKCPYVARLKHHLASHVLTVHEKLKEHNCTWDGCQRVFGEKRNLTTHVRTVHEKLKEHNCTWDGCQSVFGEKSKLTTHVRSV